MTTTTVASTSAVAASAAVAATSGMAPSRLTETVQLNYEEFSDNFLTCSICSCMYDSETRRPKLLSCSHTVCENCLRQIVMHGHDESFLCPMCREIISIPPNGISDFRPSFMITQLLDLMQQQRREVVPKCRTHTNQELCFCETCDKVFCRLCSNGHCSAGSMRVGGGTMGGVTSEHTVIPLSIAIKRMSEILLYKAQLCMKHLDGAHEMVSSEIHKLDETADKTNQHITDSFNELWEVMTRRRQELEATVGRIKSEKSRVLKEQLSLIESERSKVQAECQGLERQVEVRQISSKINDLSEKLDRATSGLAEPRENAYIRFEYSHRAFPEIRNVLNSFGAVRISKTFPSLCSAVISLPFGDRIMAPPLAGGGVGDRLSVCSTDSGGGGGAGGAGFFLGASSTQLDQQQQPLPPPHDLTPSISFGSASMFEPPASRATGGRSATSATLPASGRSGGGHSSVIAAPPSPATAAALLPPDFSDEADRCWLSAHLELSVTVQTVDYHGRKSSSGGDPLQISVISSPPPPPPIIGALSPSLAASVAFPGTTAEDESDELFIDGPVDNEDGTYTFTFTPTTSGRHTLSIKIFDRAIKGSPFPFYVTQHHPFIWKYGSKGSGHNQLSQPTSLAVDVVGRLYILDSGNRRVVVLSRAGERTLAVIELEESGVTGLALTRPISASPPAPVDGLLGLPGLLTQSSQSSGTGTAAAATGGRGSELEENNNNTMNLGPSVVMGVPAANRQLAALDDFLDDMGGGGGDVTPTAGGGGGAHHLSLPSEDKFTDDQLLVVCNWKTKYISRMTVPHGRILHRFTHKSLTEPTGVVINSHNHYIVTDSGPGPLPNSCLLVFMDDGTLIRKIQFAPLNDPPMRAPSGRASRTSRLSGGGAPASSGASSLQAKSRVVCSVCVSNRNNDLIVCDQKTIALYTASGQFVRNIVGGGVFSSTAPASRNSTISTVSNASMASTVSAMSSATLPTGGVAGVGAPNQHHITSKGCFLASCVDSRGNLLALRWEPGASRGSSVQVYNASGKYLFEIDSFGEKMRKPSHLVCTEDFHVVVCDGTNNSIKKFRYK